MACNDCNEHSGLLAEIEAIREHHKSDVRHMENYQDEILFELKAIRESLSGNGNMGIKAKLAVCIWSVGILGLTNGVLWSIIVVRGLLSQAS